MILLAILAAASTAAAQPPAQAQPGFARAAAEAQLAQRAKQGPRTGLSGTEAAAMRKTYLDQLAEKREAQAVQTKQAAK